MKRKVKSKQTPTRRGTVLVLFVVAIFVLLLVLRMIAYVAHVRRHL
jgi:Flp pilus assembly protein TadG